MSAADQWSWYWAALAGTPVDSEIGNPRSGFWKVDGTHEVIAIWRDETGAVCIERQWTDGSRHTVDMIDVIYAKASRYPITEETYKAVRAGDVPFGFKTRLTLKEIQAGVVWSLELGRKKAGAEVKAAPAADDPPACVIDPTVALHEQVAGIGHNGPPEPLSPDQALAAEISATAIGVKTWLTEIGGKPRNKPEADRMADYATAFGRMKKLAEDQHRVEKAPVLALGKEIDGKWFKHRDAAEGSRKRCLEIGSRWLDEENARRQAEADAVNAQAKAAAEKNAERFDAPVTAPPPVQAEKVTGIGNTRTVAQRSRTTWSITDAQAYGAYLLGMAEIPADLLEVMGKIAQRQGAAGVEMPGVTKDVKRTAA